MRSSEIIFRPIDTWPGPDEPAAYSGLRRSSRSFRASRDETMRLLAYEITRLDGDRAVVQLALEEADFRVDGQPKVHAYVRHPGIVVSFESKHGPLRYATDEFDEWPANLRAVALGLEHLRALDRYGITSRGEQYVGWKQLEVGGPSAERGRQLIARHGGVREALMATHPDHGGSADDFADVQAAREDG